MKKSLYSSLVLLLLTLVVTISYQNCGDVGGMSPDLGGGLDPDPTPGGQQTGELLELFIADGATIANFGNNNNVLSADLSCNYTPFNYGAHFVNFTVTGTGYSHTWTGQCSGASFNIQYTLPSTSSNVFNPVNSHTFSATLFGRADNGEIVIGGPASTSSRGIGQGQIFPPSTSVSTQNFASLAGEGGAQFRNITVLNNVPGNYYPYQALRGKLQFRVTAQLPLNDNNYYGIFEILPYLVNNVPQAEYSMSVSRFSQGTNPVWEYYDMNQFYIEGSPVAIKVPSTSGDTRRAFQADQTYIIDFVVYKNGGMQMQLYNSTATNTVLYFANATLTGFSSNSFGTQPMTIRLGAGGQMNSTQRHPSIADVVLKYRICGYTNTGQIDTTCSSEKIP